MTTSVNKDGSKTYNEMSLSSTHVETNPRRSVSDDRLVSKVLGGALPKLA